MKSISKAINPDTVWAVPAAFQPIYSHACEVPGQARFLFTSGQFGVCSDGSVPIDFRTQAGQAMTNVESLLAASGMSIANVVKLMYFVTTSENLPTLGELRAERWGSSEPPAVTVLVVAGLANTKYLVEIEAIAAA